MFFFVSQPLAHGKCLVNACLGHQWINHDKTNKPIWYQKLQEGTYSTLYPGADKAIDILFSQVPLSRQGHVTLNAEEVKASLLTSFLFA